MSGAELRELWRLLDRAMKDETVTIHNYLYFERCREVVADAVVKKETPR